MGTFVWREPRSAADLRLKYWYNRRKAEIIRDSRPPVLRAAINRTKDLHLAIMLPLLRRARLTHDDNLIARYYMTGSTDRG